MIRGTGVDLTENDRFVQLLKKENDAFFRRVFTDIEREYCEKFNNVTVKAEHYAARFAAKEAFVKALGTGFRGMKFHDIEVRNDDLGAPYFTFYGKVKQMILEHGIDRIHLSVSHSDHYSIAMVVAEGKGE